MLDLKGKVALVVGCGSVAAGWGTGRATAVLPARQSAVVYGTDLLLENALVIQEAIASGGGRAYVAVCDSIQARDVKRIVNDCMARFGRIDILVNNVGLSQPMGLVKMREEVWDEQFQVNLKGTFLTRNHVLPIMKVQGGSSVINISYVAGLRYPGKSQVAYSATKAALMQFTKTTAVIHGAEGIPLNCVVPGLMHTPSIEGLTQK